MSNASSGKLAAGNHYGVSFNHDPERSPLVVWNRARAFEQERLLGVVFVALFLQLQLIVLASLCATKGIAFVREHSFGLDLRDFLAAATDWSLGFSPYGRVRFVTPPPSLIVGMFFRHVSFQAASLAFFCVNLIAVFGAVWMICRYFRMTRLALFLMFAITSLYYPAIFLFERGNLARIILEG
jgi:hypothetical protein